MVRLIQITNVARWVRFVEQSFNAKLTAGHHLEHEFDVERNESHVTRVTVFITHHSVTESRDKLLRMTFTGFVKFHTLEHNNHWTQVHGYMLEDEVWIEF